MRRIAMLLLCCVALAASAAVVAAVAADADGPPPVEAVLEERSRVRLRTVRLRFEPTRDARPGECRALGLDDLRVRLRGELLDRDQLVELERRREPTLHALLLDTSGSMVGKLDHVRRAAAEYVERLDRDHDRALVVTFDESVILVQPPTADHDALVAAIDGIRMGAMTSLLDGMYYGIGELLPHRERPVVVLLSDGVDSASLEEQENVRRLAERRHDLIVFTIGYQLPPIDSAGTGTIATRTFLGRLAAATDGEFFDVPTGGRLDFVFGKIHEMLESEALLTFLDPEPDAPLGRVGVRLPNPHCRLHVYRTTEDAVLEAPANNDALDVDTRRVALAPAPRERFLADQRIRHQPDASCRNDAAGSLDELWYVERGPAAIHGCALDVTMEHGLLYSHLNVHRALLNDWVRMRTRAFEFPVPPIADLPKNPAEALDVLARQALAVADETIETDVRQRPAARHARPWADIPTLVNGRTLLQARDGFAWALYGYPEYRSWVHERLAADAEEELAALRARFRRAVPTAADDAIERATLSSAEGRRILARVEQPTAGDLQRTLGGWLGDIPAHRLFVEWEILHANRLLTAGSKRAERADVADELVAQWKAVRQLLFVPSYARVLGLLTPFRDEAAERIGFWRIVLPRPGWLLPRLKNARRHPEWSDLPLDLVPDLPLGFEVLREALAREPALHAQLVRDGYAVTDLRYRLLGKPYKHDPRRAFRDTHVELTLRSPTTASELRVAAHVRCVIGETIEIDSLELSAPDGNRER